MFTFPEGYTPNPLMTEIKGSKVKKWAMVREMGNLIFLEVVMPSPFAPFEIEAINVTGHEIDKLKNSLKEWAGGALIQDACPYLTADQREQMLTPPSVLGMLPEEEEE